MENSTSSRLNSQTLRTAVDEIVEKYGQGFTPKDILEYATPKDSILHDSLEWDDKKAGNAYRLQQCRMLMHRLELEETQGVREIVSFSLEETSKRGYYTDEYIMSSADLRKAALKQMYKDAVSFVKRYNKYKEVHEIVKEEALKKFSEQYL